MKRLKRLRKSLGYLLSRNGFRIKELIQNSWHYTFSKSLRKNSVAFAAKIGNVIGLGDQLIAVTGKEAHEQQGISGYNCA